MKHLYFKAILLCLCLFASINTFAYDAEIDGIYYNFISENEAEVTYKNTDYNSYSGAIVIPASVTYNDNTYRVTAIGLGAFAACTALTTVTLPSGVESIGRNAFYNCSNLASITIPNSVTNIGKSAFYQCNGLTAVYITDLVAWCNIKFSSNPVSYAHHLYLNGEEITDLVIPDGVTSIGAGAFHRCTSITSIIIPESVTTIESSAFSGCSSLSSVIIPNSITTIESSVFQDCSSLSSVTIPNSVTTIGSNAFAGCSGLSIVTIPNSVTTIESSAFSGCISLSSVIIPNSITTIESSVFQDCSSLSSVTIPNSVTTIGSNAFYNCSGLSIVTIPNSVTTIGSSAFSRCSGLKSIIIPSSVTSISDDAFSGCYFTVDSLINNSSLLSSNNWGAKLCDKETSEGLLINNTQIIVRCRPWVRTIIIPYYVTTIEANAFESCGSLTSITIPNSVFSIGRGAFYNCNELRSINIDDLAAWSNISFGDVPFAHAYHLYLNGQEIKDLIIPNSVTSIGKYAFSFSVLTSVTIHNNVKNISDGAFYGCKLHNILIKCDTPPSIGGYVFPESALYHTTLYVPVGCWDTYAFDANWYKFINIRETATTEEEVSIEQAYTLMDAETFVYSVYDPVNDCINTINSVGINEDNPNHSWQMIEAGGMHFLYNIGAKKYVKRNGTSLELTDVPEPIDVEDGENGLILGAQTAQQWALVGNEHMNVAQSAIDEVTGISNLNAADNNSPIYNLAGQRLSKMQKGINIRKGKKILVK